MLSKQNPIRKKLSQARRQANLLRERIAWWRRRQRVEQRLIVPAPLPPDTEQDTTLVWVPFAGVGPLFAPACVMARTLQERGHRVIVARCFRLFERCPVMDMHNIPYIDNEAAKSESCLKCADNSFRMLDAYGLETLDLRQIITPEMRENVRRTLEDAPANLLDLEFDGQPFGKLSAVDLVLARKIASLDSLPEELLQAWKQYIASTMLAYQLADEVCRRYTVRRLLHMNDYGASLAAKLAAGKHGIPVFGAMLASHRNIDFRRYMILDTHWKPSSFRQLESWPVFRELALSPELVREIGSDILIRLSGHGSHIYSPAKTSEPENVAGRLGMTAERKLLVAFTSSLDEVVATRFGISSLGLSVPERPQPFADQIEWLTAVADHVAASADLQLVIRIHPREGVNKNSSIQSEHLQRLRTAFSTSRPHCHVVWPEDKVSSYDLVEAADVVLTSWSTIGLESARMGVPVVVAFNGSWAAMPVDDFLEWGQTRDAYFAKLRSQLQEPPTLDRLARAYRWYNLYHLGATLDLSDLIPSSEFNTLPEYRTHSQVEAMESIFFRGGDATKFTMQRLQREQSPGSARAELIEIQRQMRRLIHFLFTGQDESEGVPMSVSIDGDRSDDGGRKVSASAGVCRHVHVRGTKAEYWL
ncbi:MAG: hypothetical protein AB7O26_00775, partial [Planctomycetaceae bacterium]